MQTEATETTGNEENEQEESISHTSDLRIRDATHCTACALLQEVHVRHERKCAKYDVIKVKRIPRAK